MTEHEISNMQPGPELDRLVAEACGMPSRIASGKCEVGYNYKRGDRTVTSAWRDFSPSTDWNDAMWSLAKADLGGQFTMGQSFDGSWWVSNGWIDLAQASTGPLAICRAILQAKQ